MGMREGVGNIVEVVENVIRHYKHSLSTVREEGKEETVDWKRVYRDLVKLVANMKQLAIKSAAEKEPKSNKLYEKLKLATTKAQACGLLSLVDMLDMRKKSNQAS